MAKPSGGIGKAGPGAAPVIRRMNTQPRRFPSPKSPTLGLVALLALAACGDGGADVRSAEALEVAAAEAPAPDYAALPEPIAAVARTHATGVPADRALAYGLDLTFGGKPRFRGSVMHTPSMDRIAMTRRDDGAALHYDGQAVALMRDDTSLQWPRARFDVFTWPYFATAPFKLADPGTQWDPARSYPWTDGDPATAARLTFAAGTGDAPDDYYVVFPDAGGRLGGMAYVVTFGKPAADVDSLAPHAIRYHDYRDVDGVPVAHRWTFHDWNPTDGLGAAVIGEATLTDARWVAADESRFATTGGAEVPRG